MREEKQLLLDEIKEKIEGSKGFVALNYQNFTAAKARAFRDVVSDLGGEFEVVKKRVFVQAASKLGLSLDVNSLQGHVGIVFANEDATPVIKGTVKFGEDNDKTLSVLGGHIEGAVCTAEDIEAIAKLPNLQEMRAQFLGLLEAPMAQTAQVLQAILTSILYCVEEKSKKE